MAKEPKVNHPHDGDHVHRFFVASGSADVTVGGITGVVRDSNGKKVADPIATARQGRLWLVVFDDLPAALRNLTLQIKDAKGTVLKEVKQLTTMEMFDAFVSWPANNTTNICDDSFVPYGTYTGGVVPNLPTMTSSGGVQTPANSINTVKNSRWFAPFPTLLADTYQLDVTQMGGMPDQRTGLGLVDC
jgi:hypothetical protein